MIDLHCHILPGIDDGAPDLAVSLAMAEVFVADGVTTVACTPHILPGLYHNTGTVIRGHVQQLQSALDAASIPLSLVVGADNHMVPDFVAQLRSGHLVSLADSRYVLVEPPHHTAPVRLEDFFFEILVGGFVPILTHPERLSWINSQYDLIARLAAAGVLMQITAGSLSGGFGRRPKYWAERMLDEGNVHILATDAHHVDRRAPDLARGFELAAQRVGEAEAGNLVVGRPSAIIANEPVSSLPVPEGSAHSGHMDLSADDDGASISRDFRFGGGWLSGRLRKLFN